MEMTKPTRTLTALRLRLLRAEVARIAALAGVSTKTIYRIRTGAVDDIAVSSADRIADALDFVARDMAPSSTPRSCVASVKEVTK